MGGGSWDPRRVHRPRRLLLVENDTELSAPLVRLLSGESYEVDVVTDGQHILYLGPTRPYDVLVLERCLPDMDGLDLLVSLRFKGDRRPGRRRTIDQSRGTSTGSAWPRRSSLCHGNRAPATAVATDCSTTRYISCR
jgi:response regulator receiver domain-containing protein